ncbi:MAG: PAS domain S-box protein [Spirochaetales bacterium]|nr:PAS domain S-box protein [Spirochaetales bacterium]
MILEDKQKNMSFSEVKQAKDQGLFRRSTSSTPSFGYTASAYWVYITIKNDLTQDNNCLLEILNMDEILLYLPDKEGSYNQKKAGHLVENPAGFLKYGNVLFKITIPAQSTQVFYIRFENQDPMIFRLNLWSLETYFLSNQTKQIFYGIYLGIIAAMILYNLFIFLTLKDISYLYYVLYIFSIGFYHLFAADVIQEYFFNMHPWLMDNLETIATGFVLIWAVQFCRHYLLTNKTLPNWDKALRIGMYFGVIIILTPLFLPFTIRSMVSSFGLLLVIITILITVIICLKKSYPPAFFYLFAWSIVAIGAVSYILRNFAILPSFFITDESILLGSILEALLLSFGLAFRIDILRKEKEQAKAHALASLKKANKFEHDYRQLFMLNPLGIALLNDKGIYIAANPAYCATYKYTYKEIIGNNFIDLIIPKNERAKEKQKFSQLFNKNQKKLSVSEQQHINRKGNLITTQCYRDYTTNESGEVTGLLLCTADITEGKKQADRIKASLEEKEYLLKEIHHRVKNNLQIVTSLINFKVRHLQNAEHMDIFKSIQNRINSIALVHNRLYLSKNLAKISFKEYIQALASHLLSALKIESHKISIKIEAKDIYLGISLAIPCGLIINELLTNALKYAFPKPSGGNIKISFYKEKIHLEDSKIHYILEIRDNGIGFPEGFDFYNTETFGLQLVITLVEQLEGNIEKIGRKGVGFKIRFYSEQG